MPPTAQNQANGAALATSQSHTAQVQTSSGASQNVDPALAALPASGAAADGALAGAKPIGDGPDAAAFEQVGRASWYGRAFQGRKTATGERFNMRAMTAAHRTLPLGTYVRVTVPHTGKSIVVKINDRGPYVHGRVLDLSYAAAKALGMQHQGTARVKIVSLPRREGRAEFAQQFASN